MTPEERHAQYLQEFGERLSAASTARRHRGRRALVVAPFVLAAVAAAVVWFAGSGDGTAPALDVVAEARAALAPTDGIAHSIVTSVLDPDGRRPQSLRIEQWSTTRPLRYRIAIPEQPRLRTGPMEISYANGKQQTYSVGSDTLTVGPPITDKEALGAAGPAGVDPSSTARTLLEQGKLKDAGTATVNGRPVRRLIGSETTADTVTRRLVYDVDPTTSEPVGGTLTITAPPSGPVTIRFAIDYEKLPLTAEAKRLLSITTTADTRVIAPKARSAATP